MWLDLHRTLKILMFLNHEKKGSDAVEAEQKEFFV